MSNIEKDENLDAEVKKTSKKEKIEKEKAELKKEIAKASTKKSTSKKEEKEVNEDEKVKKIIEKAKENGKMTYGELASELENTNSEEIDKVFDAFEDLGVDILNEDMDEPNIEDLKDVEEIKLDDLDVTNVEGVSVDDPVRMYLREIGKIPLLTYEEDLIIIKDLNLAHMQHGGLDKL